MGSSNDGPRTSPCQEVAYQTFQERDHVLICTCRDTRGALFCLYWWGLSSFFAPRIAAYEAERSKHDTTAQKQDEVVKRPEPRSKEEQPSVTFAAYLQPKQPYPDGTLIGGISWLSHYVDVRLDAANGPVQIKDLDFSVQLDTSIAGVGQISQFQGVTAFPNSEPPAAWLQGTDNKGQPTSIPIAPTPGLMRSSAVYRVHCSDVFANTVVHFVIASIALNQPTAGGGLPQHLFAPRRAPEAIRLRGSYSTLGGEVHPVHFSYNFKTEPIGTLPKPAAQLPELGLRFIYPTEPALVITNGSGYVARDIKWTVALWNLDMPDRNDPLPIPVSTYDWIKAHDEGGPQALFGNPSVVSLLKPGNRLFGSASVNCPDCTRGRTYIVYIVLGSGGWFTEVSDEASGKVLIPRNFLRETRERFFKALEAQVPLNVRTPIGER